MASFIVWAAIFQGLFLCVLYFTSKNHKSRSNKVLAFFLLSLMVEAINMFIPVDEIFEYNINEYFALPETKLFIPIFFFQYVLLKLGRSNAYRRPLIIAYILGFSVMGLTLINIVLNLVSDKALSSFVSVEVLNTIFMTQQVLAFFLSVVVLILSVIELKAYQNKVQSVHSDLSLSNIKWLWQFVFIMAPSALLWGVELMRILLGGVGSLSNVIIINWGLLFIFIYFISYKAFNHKDLFEVNSDDLEQENGSNPAKATTPNLIPPEDIDETISTLENIMKDDRLYLKSDLTIHDLAKTVEIPARKISQSINRSHSLNFSEWINSYRVEEAKKQLLEFSQNNLTIEGIGYDSGFNSRSAMYLAFKKLTGKSPGDFKQ